MLLCVLSVVATTSLTITINKPINSEAITGAYRFNATTAQVTPTNITNCTWSTSNDGVFAVNRTGNATEMTIVYATSSLTETKSTTLTINCYNETNDLIGTDTSTTVAVDNTNPTCKLGLSRAIINPLKEIELDCSKSSDTTTLTYNNTIQDQYGNLFQSSNSVATFSSEQTMLKGEYTATCRVTDQVSKSTTCSSETFYVKSNDEPLTPQETTKIKNINNNNFVMIITLIIILIVAVVAIVIGISLSKKKRR